MASSSRSRPSRAMVTTSTPRRRTASSPARAGGSTKRSTEPSSRDAASRVRPCLRPPSATRITAIEAVVKTTVNGHSAASARTARAGEAPSRREATSMKPLNHWGGGSGRRGIRSGAGRGGGSGGGPGAGGPDGRRGGTARGAVLRRRGREGENDHISTSASRMEQSHEHRSPDRRTGGRSRSEGARPGRRVAAEAQDDHRPVARRPDGLVRAGEQRHNPRALLGGLGDRAAVAGARPDRPRRGAVWLPDGAAREGQAAARLTAARVRAVGAATEAERTKRSRSARKHPNDRKHPDRAVATGLSDP